MHRVQKLLSNYGYCSRRKAEEIIDQGRVKVNGKLITLGDKAKETDTITVDNKPINKTKKIYLMLHKPIRCVTALTDDYHATVMEYIEEKERIFPIGRLDYNTSGLLLFTNDGDFANNVMHPRYEINKTYLVVVDKAVHTQDVRQLTKGVHLEDGRTGPAKVVMLDEASFEMTIHEGKNRIVRRMLKELGYQVRLLKRVKIGDLSLGKLKEGQTRKITKKDRDKIFNKS